ncbi:MAG: (d)CMP kinase [Zetaproteobacteria bacterium]|nr:MAG: (d)CMP kinase [Zetaproteobacteria bacterium]
MVRWVPKKGLQIAIDGPSGSGKGTVARMLAERLGIPVLDTGLLYRFVGWLMQREGIDLDNEQAVTHRAGELVDEIEWDAQGIRFRGELLDGCLRDEEVGRAASRVAAMEGVRKILLGLQQQVAERGCIMDGRDIGTVVLPHAQAKFFLTASQRERARRRWSQLQRAGEDVDLDQIHADIKMRDQRDAARKYAPLKPADDAITIDSTTMRIDQVVDRMLAIMERRGLIEKASSKTD